MSVLKQIAFYRNRRDEVPNQELARSPARRRDRAGIGEIAANLSNRNKSIQSDCLKVLYEIGYLEPELIAGYVGEFLRLLQSSNNRMVWGATIALATIARLRPREIWACRRELTAVIARGTLITRVWGIRILAELSAASRRYATELFPRILEQIVTADPKVLPRHVQDALVGVDAKSLEKLSAALELRRKELSASQSRKIDRLLASWKRT